MSEITENIKCSQCHREFGEEETYCIMNFSENNQEKERHFFCIQLDPRKQDCFGLYQLEHQFECCYCNEMFLLGEYICKNTQKKFCSDHHRTLYAWSLNAKLDKAKVLVKKSTTRIIKILKISEHLKHFANHHHKSIETLHNLVSRPAKETKNHTTDTCTQYYYQEQLCDSRYDTLPTLDFTIVTSRSKENCMIESKVLSKDFSLSCYVQSSESKMTLAVDQSRKDLRFLGSTPSTLKYTSSFKNMGALFQEPSKTFNTGTINVTAEI
jgi:hypothetical protein